VDAWNLSAAELTDRHVCNALLLCRALDLLLLMTGLLVVAGGVSVWYSTDDGVGKKTGGLVDKAQEGKLKDFYEFRRRYIIVYLVIMLADWMQGTVSFFTFLRRLL
jgi:Sugar-tranasporters, 12 TM